MYSLLKLELVILKSNLIERETLSYNINFVRYKQVRIQV